MDSNSPVLTETKKLYPHNPLGSLDDYVQGLVHDGPKILYDLDRCGAKRFCVIEFYAEVPERPDIDLYVALISRWCDVIKYYNKPIRVYTYIYNEECEHYLMKLVSARKDMFVTVIPGYLRKVKKP